MKRYLNIIKPYLIDIINEYKTHGLVRYHSGNKSWLEETSNEWKIQLKMAINFISSKVSDETRTLHTKNNNVEIMIGSGKNAFIEELFESFLQKYLEGLEESMRRSEFVYDSIDVYHYNLNKVSFKKIHKEYQKLSLFLINTIGKRKIFHRMVKIGKNVKQTIN